MNRSGKTMVVGTAVIAVALVCIGCGASGSNAGVAKASASTLTTVASAKVVATPTASAAPAASPTPTTSSTVASNIPSLEQAILVACDTADTDKSCLTAGTYRLRGAPDVWPVTVTIDVPAGWFEWDADTGFDGVLVDGGAQLRASGWGIMFTTVGDVARDPCDPTKGMTPAAQVDTPQKLAAAMASWPRFTATSPQPITVDGHSGLRLQLTSTDPSSCNATGSIWRTTSGGTTNVYPMIGSASGRAPGTFEIVDTGHGLLVIRTTDFSQTSPNEIAGGLAPNPTRHAADLAALDAIRDSIRLIAQPGAQ